MLGLDDPVGFELMDAACSTRAAAGLVTVKADVSTVPLEPFVGKVDGLISSPPCQSFSQAGKGEGVAHFEALVRFIHGLADTGWVDPPADAPWDRIKTGLVLEPLRWAWTLKPRWIACEQVPPVLPVWQATAVALRAWGYSTWAGVLSSEQYGVPQTRSRAILMAHADRPVGPPAPTHQEYVPGVPARREETLFGTLEPWVSMAEALGWGWHGETIRDSFGTPAIDYPGREQSREKPMSSPSPTVDTKARDWRVGFPRLDDRGDSPDGYRERDWREGDEPSFSVTEKARSWTVDGRDAPGDDDDLEPGLEQGEWTVSTGTNSMKHSRRTEDMVPHERSIDAPAPTVDAKAPGAWQVGPAGHRAPERREGTVTGSAVEGRVVTTSNFTAVARDADGSRSKAGSVPYERDVEAPAPTLTGDAGAWQVGPPSEDLVEYAATVEADRAELDALRRDVAAARRLFGVEVAQ